MTEIKQKPKEETIKKHKQKKEYLLSEEWRKKTKEHLRYMSSTDKYVDRPEIESRDGIALILEALLSL